MGKYEPILKVAALGNMTKAANELGYTQSGLSHMIKNMEKELHISIFQRERQGVTLTKAGAELIEIMLQIEGLENTLYETALSYRTSSLKVGSLYSVSANWIPGILKDFYTKYPNTLVTLIEKADYQSIEEDIRSGALDCGFFAGTRYQNVDFIPLYKDSYYAILPLDNPLSGKDIVSLEDISHYPFIMPSEGISNTVIRELIKDLHMSPNLISESLDDLATLTLVENGLGITILPGLIAKTTFRKIATASLQGDYYRTIGIMCKSYENSTEVVKSFIQSTKNWVLKSPYGAMLQNNPK